jgi:pantothenate kinase
MINLRVSIMTVNLKDPNSSLFIIGICGVPGSGKSTLSKELRNIILNSGINVQIIPFDGYHISLKDLDKNLIYYRGCYKSFYVDKFQKDIIKFVENGSGSFPSFDHALKDPIENDIIITSDTKVVIIEGIYIFNKELEELNNIYDIKIFLTFDLNKLISSVALRNYESGIFNSYEESIERATKSDLKNGEFVMETSNYNNCIYYNYNTK